MTGANLMKIHMAHGPCLCALKLVRSAAAHVKLIWPLSAVQTVILLRVISPAAHGTVKLNFLERTRTLMGCEMCHVRQPNTTEHIAELTPCSIVG